MNVISQLKELLSTYDHAAMNTIVESLSPTQLEAYKQEIIETYDTLYSYGIYDLDCDKVSDPVSFTFYLLDIIASIQRFFPDQTYYQERGCCYQYLAGYAAAYEDKVHYIQEAIRICSLAPQTTGIQMLIVSALTDKMEITAQFTTEAFTELLHFFRPVLSDTSFVNALIHHCFRVRSLPFEQNHYWHQRLLSEFEVAMYEHAEENRLVYLDWAETYHYILYQDADEIEPAYQVIMAEQTASLLQPLEGYYTEDAELLNRLGKAFANTAQKLTEGDLQLVYYRIAVNFFTKGHEQQPAAWTFPVYATNALLGMAHIYHKQGAYEKLINIFEHGLQLFSQVYKHEEDFQVNIYWGDFLLAYSGMVYNFKSPSINHLAEKKLWLAAELGRNYYSRPYISMARLAIKSGDKQKCVNLLIQCRDAIRSTGYNAYNLSEVLNDEDFRDIRDQVNAIG